MIQQKRSMTTKKCKIHFLVGVLARTRLRSSGRSLRFLSPRELPQISQIHGQGDTLSPYPYSLHSYGDSPATRCH